MRKSVLLVGLAVLSTTAHASKARVEALGASSGRGSHYIADTRNVFRNAALVNSNKNFVVTEWGSAAVADSVASPRAEGGFFREMGTFSYGLYLGSNASAARTTTGGTFVDHQNGLDFFFAGDMGVQWGARLHYAAAKDATGTFEKKHNAMGLGLGVVYGDMEGYANVDLNDKSTGANVAGDEWKNKTAMNLGANYKWNGNTFFAEYNKGESSATKGSGSAVSAVTINSRACTFVGTSCTGKSSDMRFGAGRIHEVNPTSRVFTDASVLLTTTELSGGNATTQDGKIKTTTLPLAIGFETDATSWLSLRGSVTQNVFLNETKDIAGKKSTNSNTTNVAAGATLNFGKLKVDGIIGTTAFSRGATTASEEGVLATDNLMSRVGVSYWF